MWFGSFEFFSLFFIVVFPDIYYAMGCDYYYIFVKVNEITTKMAAVTEMCFGSGQGFSANIISYFDFEYFFLVYHVGNIDDDATNFLYVEINP